MNISDYFKRKADKPIDALIDELQDNDVPILLCKRPADKSESEALIDHILNASSKDDICIPT